MSTSNKLAAFIALVHGDRAATIETAVQAFADDFTHFARANNREPLNAAVKALGKTAKDKALAAAISEGYKASGLVNGYIGAQSGKYASQPDDVRASFEAAIVSASDAFKLSISECEAFASKAVRTDADKARAKDEKAEKAAAAKAALITELVQSGELVRSADVKKIEDFAQIALIDALKIQGVDVDSLTAERDALTVERRILTAERDQFAALVQTLTAERDALTAERDALTANKARKTTKA